LQRLHAEDVLDLEILHPAVGTVGVDEELLAAAEKLRGQREVGGDLPRLLQPADRPGDSVLGLGHVGRTDRLGGVDGRGRLLRVRFRHAAENPRRKLRLGAAESGRPGQVLRLFEHDAEMGVGELAEVVEGDVRKLAVVEIAQHGLRRGVVHRPIVIRTGPEFGLFLVAPDALLPAHVPGPFAFGYADPPVGGQQQRGAQGQQSQ